MMCRDHPSHWMHLTAEILRICPDQQTRLQRRMDINTGVLLKERQPSCTHGAVVCVDEIDDSIFGREFEPLQNSFQIFWKWWQIMNNVPLDLMLCHVFTVTLISTGLKFKIEIEIF